MGDKYQRKSLREQTQIYHFTELSNLDTIITYGLLSRAEMKEKGLLFEDVADPQMLDARKDYSLEKCVPFHFMGNSPFAGKVRDNHPCYDFIYLAISRDTARFLKFMIAPTHPRHMEYFQPYEFDEGIKVIDWVTMDRRDYTDYECKEVCMAECLSYKAISIEYFNAIYVKNQEIKDIVEDKLYENNLNRIHVNLMPQWF